VALVAINIIGDPADLGDESNIVSMKDSFLKIYLFINYM
jgi:hypothetical protein